MNENDNYDVFDYLEDLVAPASDTSSQALSDEEIAQLDITDKDGSRYGFPRYTLRSLSFHPIDGALALDFGTTLVTLTGRNLGLVYTQLLDNTLGSLKISDPLYDEGEPDTWSIHHLVITKS
ncbi:MAG: hypothetical protein AAF927_02425 [Bacteroidota bacterium]